VRRQYYPGTEIFIYRALSDHPPPGIGIKAKRRPHAVGRRLQVDALKELQQQTDGKLTALLPAILNRAFKGEL
jgi:hypothetical protein